MKSRTLATQFIEKGRVRLTRNGQIQRLSKSHMHIYPGDELTFMRGKTLWHIRILALGHRRGPASEARTLYEVLEPHMD